MRNIIPILLLGSLSLVNYHSNASSDADNKFYVDNPYFEGSYAMKVEEVRDFFLKLKQSVESSDKNWLSQNTSYPIEITHHGKSTTIENRDSFKKNYELIFNKEIRAAVRCQEFNKLFANWKGVMIGQGAVWFKLQNIDSYSTTKNITTSPYTDVTADESIKTIDINDRKKWQYRIISINSDISTEQFIKRCPSYRR